MDEVQGTCRWAGWLGIHKCAAPRRDQFSWLHHLSFLQKPVLVTSHSRGSPLLDPKAAMASLCFVSGLEIKYFSGTLGQVGALTATVHHNLKLSTS